MRTIGIVGSEGAKFTDIGEARAKALIKEIVSTADAVSSGECHLGGIDIWAKEEAIRQGKKYIPRPPKTRTWEGYKARNEKIAEDGDETVCITVDSLPPGFKEGGWERYCYHCKTDKHIKSGGCWTTKHARKLGKNGYTLVIKND